MKKYLLLLLFTTIAIAQNPTRFPYGVQITNTVDTTANFVNVQGSSGVINKIDKVDLIEVLEYSTASSLPITGVAGKIYITIDNSLMYRWNGTFYSPLTTDISGKEDLSNKTSVISGYSETLYPNEKATHDGLDLKLNISDLPTNLTLYPTTVASDVSGYVKMVTDIHDTDYNTIAVDISTPIITTVNQLISSRISAAGVLVGQPGVFNITTFGNIRHLSGSGSASFYFEVYQRTSAGVETLICVSSNSLPVTNGGYSEFSASGVWNNGSFLSTDRIVIKSYANRIEGGSDPIYQFQFGGDTPIRTILPVPFSVVDAGYEVKINKVSTLTASDILYPNNNGVIAGLATKVGISNIETLTGKKTLSPTVSATLAKASGTIISPILNATDNNEVLIGLESIPTFNTSSFTGIKKYGFSTSESLRFGFSRVDDGIYGVTVLGSNIISITRQNQPNFSSVAFNSYGGMGFKTNVTDPTSIITNYNLSINTSGRISINSNIDNGVDYLQIPTGTISHLPATLSNQGVVKSQLDTKQDILVSGTSIKTIEGQSVLGSGNIDLLKADVGLSNVDNTSDLNKPISTATQTALNLKANDNAVAHLAGAETFIDAKTFNETPIVNKLVTTTNIGQAYELVKNGAGTVLSKHQVNVWNGTAYVASNNGLFNGQDAGQNNAGINIGGISGYAAGKNNAGGNIGSIIGYAAGQYNTGGNIGGISGYFAGQYNTGGNIGSIIGYVAGQYNTGGNIGGISGYAAGQHNTGGNIGGISGYAAGRYNAGANNVIGSASHTAFLTNNAGIKAITDAATDINITTNIVTIAAHGFGSNDSYSNLNYTTTGTPIGGLTSGSIYKVKIVDANNLLFYANDITSVGTNTHSFTPQFKYDNVNIYGNNVTPTKSNQTIIGNSSTTEFRAHGFHLIGTNDNNGIDGLQTPLTISHAPATLSNQGVVKSQLDLKANDSEVAHIDGTETFLGAKFFDLPIGVADGTIASPSIRFYEEASGDTGFNHMTDGVINVISNGVISASFTPTSLNLTNSISATSHVTTGGLASQNVKGDGSLSVGYKVYTALLSQSGTAAPVATVLENTLGGTVVWTRDSTGIYYGTLSGAFTASKTTGSLFNGDYISTSPAYFWVARADNDRVSIRSTLGTTTADGIINGALVEIRVYN